MLYIADIYSHPIHHCIMSQTTANQATRTGRLRFIALLASMICIVSLTSSCTSEDDPYYSPLVGGWQLVDYSGQGTYYISSMMLYSDGTGYVTGLDDYGYSQTWSVQWSSYSSSSLTIYFNDAYASAWSYYYNFSGGELHLQPINDVTTDYWYMRA